MVQPTMSEVEEEVNYPKLHQKFSNLLTAPVLGLADVGADVP